MTAYYWCFQLLGHIRVNFRIKKKKIAKTEEKRKTEEKVWNETCCVPADPV